MTNLELRTRIGSHKDTEYGKSFSFAEVKERMRNEQMCANLVKAVATGNMAVKDGTIRTPWNPDDGGILYKQVATKDKDRYRKLLTFTDAFDAPFYFVPVAVVKPRAWRFHNNDGKLLESDIVSLPAAEHKKDEPYQPQVGTELELFSPHGRLSTPTDAKKITDKRGLSIANRKTLKQLRKENATITLEALRYTTEVNFHHGSDLQNRAKSDLRVIQNVAKEADRVQQRFLPVSMYPDELAEDDCSSHSYAQGIGDKNPNKLLYRPSHSLQITVENASLEEGRQAINMWYQTTHLLKALTLDSTVAFGTLNPNMHDIISQKVEEFPVDQSFLLHSDHDAPLSTREASRLFGSHLGAGVIQDAFPTDAYEFWAAAEQIITDGESPTPDRVGHFPEAFHHGNMRHKPSIGIHSANEIAVLDTIGGDPIKTAAIKEMAWRLNTLFNITHPEDLAKRAPALFNAQFTPADGQRLQIASLLVDTKGVEAEIKDAKGNTCKAEMLVRQLINLASQPIIDEQRGLNIPEMPTPIKGELYKSARIPTEKDFRNAEGTIVIDNIVIPSVRGWYGTQGDETRGIGTPAHWRRARINALKQLGMYSDEAIKKDYILDGEHAFHNRVVGLTEADIDTLYEPAVTVFS